MGWKTMFQDQSYPIAMLMEMLCIAMFDMVATGYMWLLSTWHVAKMGNYILILFILISLLLKSPIRQMDTIGEYNSSIN